jgi:NAD(P)-dependent dehydrogenase (short-subunit alcohol dehydrogenase family)
MTSSKWTAQDLPNLENRTFVVTGANSGIGLVAARALGGAGARVVLAVRNTAKGEAAAAAIDGETEVRELDLADLASVHSFADAWEGDLDVLVNNAGVMAVPEQRTKDGFEMQLGTNHLGHFALTNLLLPHVRDRVVVVASGAHRFGSIHLDDLNWERHGYSRWRAYGQSKLANLLFMSELQRRLDEAGSSIRVTAHPGLRRPTSSTAPRTSSRTRLGHRQPRHRPEREMGALPTLFAATQDARQHVRRPRQPGRAARTPQGRGRSGAARDDGDRPRLWSFRGAHRRRLPAGPGGRVVRTREVFPRRRAAP